MFKKLSVLAACFAAMISFAQIPDRPAERVTDKVGVLSSEVRASLNTKLANLERANGTQLLVYVDKSLNGQQLEDFSNKAARAWHPGQKQNNNGAVFFVFISDRKMRIEVGRGLEPVMPDVTCRNILDTKVKPSFKQGNYSAGIVSGVDAMIACAGKGQFTHVAGTITAPTIIGQSEETDYTWWILGGLLVLLIVILLFRKAVTNSGYGGSSDFYYFGGSGSSSNSSYSGSSSSDSSWGSSGGDSSFDGGGSSDDW